MGDMLVKVAFCVFGLLCAQLVTALAFGCLNGREHRFSRPAWLVSALLLAAGSFEVITSEWVYILAGVVAAMAVIHIGVEHSGGVHFR